MSLPTEPFSPDGGATDRASRSFHKRTDQIIASSHNRRHIYVFKYLLPVGAVTLLTLIVAWPYLSHAILADAIPYSAQEALGGTVENTAMKPQFNGVDKNNQPYVLQSDYGVQLGESELTLTNPIFTLRLNSGETVTLKSNTAHYDQKINIIHLTGDVVLTHTTGYRFHTSEAWMNLETGVAHGQKPIDGEGPAGKIQSPEGFHLSDAGDQIKFLGRTEMVITHVGK